MVHPLMVLEPLEVLVLKDLVRNPPSVVRRKLEARGFNPDNIFANICEALGVNNLIAAALIAYHNGLIGRADIGAALEGDPQQPTLTPRQIAVLRGRYENRSHTEIARMLGLTRGGVNSLMARALEALGQSTIEKAVKLGKHLGYY